MRETSLRFTVEGGTTKNLRTGASIHFGRESGVHVLNIVVEEYVRRNEFCQAGNVISRAVSPRLEQVVG